MILSNPLFKIRFNVIKLDSNHIVYLYHLTVSILVFISSFQYPTIEIQPKHHKVRSKCTFTTIKEIPVV